MNRLIDKLIDEQLKNWSLASTNFEALASVKNKSVVCNGIHYRVQFNPARIVSSSAKVDTKSIQERKCFLCEENRPEVQKGVSFKQYEILINPFPIFPKHLTIPDKNHVDQLIKGRVGDMLELAKEIDDYVIFYNGPNCGASAPDHMHFQAGNKGFLPLETDSSSYLKEEIMSYKEATLYLLNDSPRNTLLIKAFEIEDAVYLFNKLYKLLPIAPETKEPMMNLLAWYSKGEWHLAILLRKKHRPNCYFAEGEDRIISSPASVDLGGVFISPIEKDFIKLNDQIIKTIISEVSPSTEEVKAITNQLKV